jgi:hypothetical protein
MAELRRSAAIEYRLEDLLEQQRGLLEFLGKPRAIFVTLQNSRGGPLDRRRELALQIVECRDRIRPLFPGIVQASLNLLANTAGTWASDYGLERVNPLNVIDLMRYHWTLLEGYERVLRELLVEGERIYSTRSRLKQKPTHTFPTPPGTKWEDVTIKFTDGHTVSIRIGTERGVYTYAELGMSSRKNRMPTVQWKLLQIFAAHHGTLTWKHPEADPKLQKRSEILAKTLRAFFGIGDAPIRVTAGRGLSTRFRIMPEKGSSDAPSNFR